HEDGGILSGLMSRPQVCLSRDADSESVVASLVQGLLAEAESEKMITVYTWSHRPLDAFTVYGFRRRVTEGDVVLDLRLGPEALFRQFHETRRRNIRLATRNGVEVSMASTEEDIAGFYEVYSQWRHTERKEIHHNLSFEVFLNRYRYNKANYRFFLARHSGRIIAGVTARAYPSGLVEFANNSSLDEFLHLRPNDLLQWRIIEWACASGYSRYSLGGAHTFLRRFGGKVIPIYRYRLDRTFLRRHDLHEGLMDTGRSVLRKCPPPVEKAVRKLLGK
ncbi:MAG: GNAT family N-acetyltransferase, partial [Terriglobia bacterium]